MRITCYALSRTGSAASRSNVAIALVLAGGWPLFAQTPATLQNAQTGVVVGAQPGTQAGTQTGTLPSPLSPLPPGTVPYTLHSLVTTPTVSPGALTLLELDGRLNQAVAAGGGSTFASWFTETGVALNNGKVPVQGRANIAATATWKPADYQLSWTPQGASMGPSGDMGYTWGSYQGRARDPNGQTITTAGRYVTVWQKQPDGQWRITLEASADDAPAGPSDCCALPRP